MTVGERIKTISQDWFLTEPLIFAVLCTHALKRNDNMGCDMRCGKGLIEYNPERLEHFVPAPALQPAPRRDAPVERPHPV